MSLGPPKNLVFVVKKICMGTSWVAADLPPLRIPTFPGLASLRQATNPGSLFDACSMEFQLHRGENGELIWPGHIYPPVDRGKGWIEKGYMIDMYIYIEDVGKCELNTIVCFNTHKQCVYMKNVCVCIFVYTCIHIFISIFCVWICICIYTLNLDCQSNSKKRYTVY